MGGWYSWAPLGDLDKPGNNGFCPGPQLRPVSLRSGARLRCHRRQGDAGEGASPGHADFAPAITPHFWDDNRFPAYTYDKISIGMIDAHEFAGATEAFKVLDATLDSVREASAAWRHLAREQYERPHKDESFCWDEPYTLPENPFSPGSAARAPLQRSGRSASSPTTGTGIRSLRARMCFPASMPTAT